MRFRYLRSRRLAGLAIGIFVALPPAFAQQAPDLQQQLRQLKQPYEQTTQELQQRISVLERQIENQKNVAAKEKEATVSAVNLATERAVKRSV